MFAIRFFSMYGYGWRLCTLLLMCLLGSNIAAHEGRPIHLQLEQQTPQRFELRWRIPPVLSDIQLPEFSLEGCRLIRPDSLQPRFAGRRQYQCEAEKTANNVADTRPKAVTLVYPLANPVLSVLLQYRWLNGDSNTLLVGPSERYSATRNPHRCGRSCQLPLHRRRTYSGRFRPSVVCQLLVDDYPLWRIHRGIAACFKSIDQQSAADGHRLYLGAFPNASVGHVGGF